MKHYKIKSIFPILCIFMAFVLSSCSQTANEKDTLSKSLTAESFLSQMQIKNNIEELFLQKNEILSTASVYNITYGLDNYRKMYLFSSPVREYANQQLVTINRSIKTGENALFEVHNSSYDILFFENKILLTNFYQNISLYIEKLTEEVKKESYSGIYHSVNDCITYKNDEIEFHFIPTYYGLAIELNILEKSDSDLLIPIDLENCNYQNDNAGYIKIFEENSDVAVIYPGISTDSCGELFINKGLTLTRQNNQTYLKFQLGDLMNDSIDFPIQSSISLDLYNEKMFFDSSVYQNKPQLNSFLSNISIFDNKNSENCGYTYLKLNLDSITPANSSLLKSLYYNFFAIECSEDVDLEAYLVPQTWCSFTINWDDKPEYTQKIGEVHIDGPGYYSLDITNFARNYIENSINYSAECSLLLKLKDSNKGLLVLASADNTSMPPYFEVNYSVEG